VENYLPLAGVGLKLSRIAHDGAGGRSESYFVSVVQVTRGGPASLCGRIERNDVLIEIAGQEVTKMDMDEVLARVIGPEGSHVSLKLGRQSGAYAWVFSVDLQRLSIKNASLDQYRLRELRDRYIHTAVISPGKAAKVVGALGTRKEMATVESIRTPQIGGALMRRYLASRAALSSPNLFSPAPIT